MTGILRKTEGPATYADLVALPDNVVGEIINGQLFASPWLTIPQAAALSFLGAAVGAAFHSAPGGWWVLDKPELHLGDDVLVPDIAGWRRERLPKMPSADFLTLAPDWVCEVVSPATAALDRIRKSAVYAREQVGHCWYADPAARTLEVFRLLDGRWASVAGYEGGLKVRAEPFDAVELDLARGWGEP